VASGPYGANWGHPAPDANPVMLYDAGLPSHCGTRRSECFASDAASIGSGLPNRGSGRLRYLLDWACRQLQYCRHLPRH
jgi:hypothetical protein